MWRFLAGVGSAMLLMTASLFVWRAQAERGVVLPPAPTASADAPIGVADLAPPPVASEKTREQKRFSRYDKDKNGAVARDEYLVARQKTFAKLDLNRDGKLGFDEYAVKTTTKFAAADKDRNNVLSATEFATTRVVRKAKAQPKCPPGPRLPTAAPDEVEES